MIVMIKRYDDNKTIIYRLPILTNTYLLSPASKIQLVNLTNTYQTYDMSGARTKMIYMLVTFKNLKSRGKKMNQLFMFFLILSILLCQFQESNFMQ